MHTSHTYHCHEHDAHKEHTHGRIFFRYRAQLEKPRDFDPFGHAGFAHLWLQYD